MHGWDGEGAVYAMPTDRGCVEDVSLDHCVWVYGQLQQFVGGRCVLLHLSLVRRLG